MLQVVGPKREKLREAETQLAEANRKLAEKQAMLKAVIDRVEGLQKQLSTAQQEQKDLNDQVSVRGGLAPTFPFPRQPCLSTLLRPI